MGDVGNSGISTKTLLHTMSYGQDNIYIGTQLNYIKITTYITAIYHLQRQHCWDRKTWTGTEEWRQSIQTAPSSYPALSSDYTAKNSKQLTWPKVKVFALVIIKSWQTLSLQVLFFKKVDDSKLQTTFSIINSPWKYNTILQWNNHSRVRIGNSLTWIEQID